jgi:hypothetical protein
MDCVCCLDEENKECVQNCKNDLMNLSQAVSLRKILLNSVTVEVSGYMFQWWVL